MNGGAGKLWKPEGRGSTLLFGPGVVPALLAVRSRDLIGAVTAATLAPLVLARAPPLSRAAVVAAFFTPALLTSSFPSDATGVRELGRICGRPAMTATGWRAGER